MSLLVDVQEVPWRILELVRARILANRESKARRQQVSDVRKHTRPRPQQRRMGATMSTYREPEPVPLVLDGLDKIAFAVVEETVSGNNLIVTVSNRDRTQSVTLTIPQLVMTYPQSDWFNGEEGFDTTVTGDMPHVGNNGRWEITILYPELDTSTKVQTTTYRRQIKRVAAQDTATGLIILPCGSEAAILVYRYDAIACTAVIKLTSSETGTRTVRDTYTYFNSLGAEITYVLFGRQIVWSYTAQTLTNSQTECVYRAVYVSAQTVKEIPVPAELRRRMGAICPEPDQLGTTTSAPLYTDTFGEAIYEPPSSIVATGETTPLGDPVIDVSDPGSQTPFPLYSDITVNMPQISLSIASVAESAYALTGWGFYRRNNTQDATPGIFSFLERFNLSSATGEEGDSYTYARSEYLQGAPVPGRFLGACAIPGGCEFPSGEPATIRFDRTSVIPDNTSTVIPVQSFRPGTRKYALTVGEDETYVAAWDWGRPAYCRQQLLALGFTEADLSP